MCRVTAHILGKCLFSQWSIHHQASCGGLFIPLVVGFPLCVGCSHAYFCCPFLGGRLASSCGQIHRLPLAASGLLCPRVQTPDSIPCCVLRSVHYWLVKDSRHSPKGQPVYVRGSWHSGRQKGVCPCVAGIPHGRAAARDMSPAWLSRSTKGAGCYTPMI